MKRKLIDELKEGVNALADMRRANTIASDSYTIDQLLKDYARIIDEQQEEIASLNKRVVKMLKEFQEIEQILGKALNYPWFKDDQETFPNATEADGVVSTGPTWLVATEAADKIKELQEQLDKHKER
jgi:hypothetical protein